MTYQDAISILPQEDQISARLFAITELMKAKGFAAPGEIEKHVIAWTKRTYGERAATDIGMITAKVSDHFRLSAADIKRKSNCHKYVLPRQVIMYLARALTEMSLKQISNYLNLKNHTTVLYGVETIAAKREGNKDLDNFIRKASEEFTYARGGF